jgi:TonB family protein
MVFANGAVIRLAAEVDPGQLIFLTNCELRREVVAQVVRQEGAPKMKGFVELEFTEPAPGFWGIEIPDVEAETPAAPTSKKIASQPAPKPAPAKTAGLPAMILPQAAGGPVPSSPVATSPAAGTPAPEPSDGLELEYILDNASTNGLDKPEDVAAEVNNSSVEELKKEVAGLQKQLESLLKSNVNGAGAAANGQTSAAPSGDSMAETVRKMMEMANSNSAGAQEASAEQAKLAELLSTLLPNAPSRPAGDSVLANAAEHANEHGAHEMFAENLHDEALPEQAEDAEASGKEESEPEAEVHEEHGRAPKAARGRERGEVLEVPAPSREGSKKKFAVWAIAAAMALTVAGGAWYWKMPLSLAGALRATAAPMRAILKPAAKSENDAADGKNEAGENSAKDAGEGAADGNTDGAAAGAQHSKGGLRDIAKNAIEKLTGKSHAGTDNAKSSSDSATPAPTEVSEPEMVPAKLLKKVEPEYPAEAMTNYVAGDVKIDAIVDEGGHVKEMKVLSGPAVLQDSAMKALKKWQYAPATRGGKPTVSHVNATVQFWLAP